MSLAPFHPQLVHFVVALGFAGVALRLLSLTGRLAWTRPAGAALLLVAAGASVAAVQSGHDAHSLVERVPGSRDAVVEHEELGERTRNIFLVLAGFELMGLTLARRAGLERSVHVLSALVGLVGSYFLFETAEHGGDLVYRHAGGIGLRTGDTTDVRRLLVAGLFHEARVAREAGRAEEAARLTDELARQAPGDPSVMLLHIESRLRDRQDAAGALADLAALPPPPPTPEESRVVIPRGLLEAEALGALGLGDSARAVLESLSRRFPDSPRVKAALDQLR